MATEAILVKGEQKKLRKWLPHVSSAQLKAATLFYAKCRDEIDAAIADDNGGPRRRPGHAEGVSPPGVKFFL